MHLCTLHCALDKPVNVNQLASHKQGTMQLFGSAGLFLNLCLLIGVANCNGAATKDQHLLNQPKAQSLYNASDNVIILNASNFNSTVYGDSKGWLVKFYNSWCGACVRFAPTWKAFASDIHGWKDIVVIAAINCVDSNENNAMCREYEVVSYPSIKYFSLNADTSSLGTMMDKVRTVEGLRYNLVERLVKEQEEGRGSSWPNIIPYKNNETANIWKSVPNPVKYFFLIFEEEDSYLGTEVILDLHHIPIIQIRRVTSENELWFETNKVTDFPTIIAFSRNESQRFLNLNDSSRDGVYKVIITYLTSNGENILIEEAKLLDTSTQKIMVSQLSLPFEEMKERDSSISEVMVSQDSFLIKEEKKSSIREEDNLYQLDLENALRYSLFREIPLSKNIKGEKLEVLKNYLSLLARYFPFRHNCSNLEGIYNVTNEKEEITGKDFIQLLKSDKQMSSIYSGPSQWVGCKGSSEGYRGYPCGLWTLYHMLSVNCAIQDNGFSQNDSMEVLKTMHGYVKHFFGCEDCVQHFLEMASKNKIFEVRTGDENILWLWKAHNEVNAKLAGDATEDPKHKKIQYPAAEHCPFCRYANNSWDEEQVLSYLKQKYSYAAINYCDATDKQQSNGSTKLADHQEIIQCLLLAFVISMASMQHLVPSY